MEEVTMLDCKQQMWKEGGAIPRKDWHRSLHLRGEEVPPTWLEHPLEEEIQRCQVQFGTCRC